MMTRVVHWAHYRDGTSCAHRATLVRKLFGKHWSAHQIADALGLTYQRVMQIGTSVVGTTADLGTQTNPTSRGTTQKRSVQNSKGSTASGKDKP